MYDLFISLLRFPFVIGVINEINASAKYVITSPSSRPYIIPPSLSNCLITGSFAINAVINFKTIKY